MTHTWNLKNRLKHVITECQHEFSEFCAEYWQLAGMDSLCFACSPGGSLQAWIRLSACIQVILPVELVLAFGVDLVHSTRTVPVFSHGFSYFGLFHLVTSCGHWLISQGKTFDENGHIVSMNLFYQNTIQAAGWHGFIVLGTHVHIPIVTWIQFGMSTM